MASTPGRLGPQLEGGEPDLRNLGVYVHLLDDGDLIALVSDGVHDNLDPEQQVLCTSKRARKYHANFVSIDVSIGSPAKRSTVCEIRFG